MRLWIDTDKNSMASSEDAVFVFCQDEETKGEAGAAHLFHPDSYPEFTDIVDRTFVFKVVGSNHVKLVWMPLCP